MKEQRCYRSKGICLWVWSERRSVDIQPVVACSRGGGCIGGSSGRTRHRRGRSIRGNRSSGRCSRYSTRWRAGLAFERWDGLNKHTGSRLRRSRLHSRVRRIARFGGSCHFLHRHRSSEIIRGCLGRGKRATTQVCAHLGLGNLSAAGGIGGSGSANAARLRR